MKSIAILGTGPAGLMAAYACSIAGRPFSLFGFPSESGAVEPSEISGAQFVHEPIPGLMDSNNPSMEITYVKHGTEEGYAEKVYSSDPNVPFVSFSNVVDGEVQPAWDLRGYYRELWEGIAGEGSSVNAEIIDAMTLYEWTETGQFDFIVSTIPRPAVCLANLGIGTSPHPFLSQTVFVHSGEYANISENTIVYNGDKEPSWYRASNILGEESTEWASERSVHPSFGSKVRKIGKPILHGCDCWSEDENVLFAGRYGKWQKGILVHDGFTTCASALMDRGYL